MDRIRGSMAHKCTSVHAGRTAKATHVREQGNGDGCDHRWENPKNRSPGHVAMLEKTQDFFQICDIEDKGFITRRDMQRLHGELPLTADELENVFETLDADGNGYLTLEEFSTGFSEFLFGRRISTKDLFYQHQGEQKLADRDEEEEKSFGLFLENLGASNVFEDSSDVRSLWTQLRRDEPHLLSNFEEFLARVTVQLKEASQEKREMESALQRKVATHNDELQQLYEEMEHQIKTEKDRILHQAQDSEHFLYRSQNLEQRLSCKEVELEQLVQKQRRLERECQDLHCEQAETRVENVKLKTTNEQLACELAHTSKELSLAQEQLEMLQQEATRLQEEREMEMYRLTESLQRDQASLLKQLDLLRETNKHLRDERDICYLKPRNSPPILRPFQRCGTVGLKFAEEMLGSEDNVDTPKRSNRKSVLGVSGHGHPVRPDGTPPMDNLQLQRVISIEEDPSPQVPAWSMEEEAEPTDLEMSNIYTITPGFTIQATPPANDRAPSSSKQNPPSSLREQPVGRETDTRIEATISSPDRLFKVVVVGNSSVGKTSVLQRFCDDSFLPGTSATIGIDYSVKTVTVENSQVALQMWDTAGQERYRSITKQFFRKADGVIVMYDVTSQQTFMAVRQWLASVQDSAGGDIPIMLLGNKVDMESVREVQVQVGEKLAKDSQLIFYECSAFSGQNVTEAMLHLARVLKEQEDEEKERTVQLAHSPPATWKKSCC